MDRRKDRCAKVRTRADIKNSVETGKMGLAPGKINTSPLHCPEIPERLRSMLGLLSGVRWGVETILLPLKVNDYFSWLDNSDSSKRLKYGL